MSHFSIDATAEILGLPPSIVDKLVHSGQLPSAEEGVPAEVDRSDAAQRVSIRALASGPAWLSIAPVPKD